MLTGLHQLLAGLVRSSAAPGQTLAETGTHALACQMGCTELQHAVDTFPATTNLYCLCM